MEFTKMHGSGNDYIILDCMNSVPNDLVGLARTLSDRHFGVGGDGIICVCPSSAGDFAMRMFNADGSEGEMCGNGVRCFAKYVYDRGITAKKQLRIETLAGIRAVDLRISNGEVISVTVDMGIPLLGNMAEIYINENSFTGMDVSMGNPHFVMLVPDVEEVDVPKLGRTVEKNPRFPHGVNVEFVSVVSRGRMAMRVWERGSGETLACGTGACAAVAAAHVLGRVDRKVSVALPGGELEVIFRERDGHLLMTGPAVTVFEGRWLIDGVGESVSC